MSETPNHNYNVPEAGSQNWHNPLNENFETLEVEVEIRDDGDPDTNGYEPEAGTKYLDTENGTIFLGIGSAWEPAFVLARDESDGAAFDGTLVVEAQNEVGISGHASGDGESVGVKGTVDSADGYGLYTPDAAKIGGTVETEGSWRVEIDGERALEMGATETAVPDNELTIAGSVVVGPLNHVMDDALGATISGGGGYDEDEDEELPNAVSDHLGTVGGGARNIVGDFDEDPWSAVGATIGGGSDNAALETGGTIGGGFFNSAAEYASVGGGFNNRAFGASSTIGGGTNNGAGLRGTTVSGGVGNLASGEYATVAGGRINDAEDDYATVSGGRDNVARRKRATVAGGQANEARGEYSTIGGGESNRGVFDHTTVAGGSRNEARDEYATVGGGRSNEAEREYSTVAGGERNEADGAYGAIGGGELNVSASYATVGGGYRNGAPAGYSTVGGGNQNVASGGYASIGGGSGNGATGTNTTVGGGENNQANRENSTVGGGNGNLAEYGSTVAGGLNNRAEFDNSTIGGGVDNRATRANATIAGGNNNRSRGVSATVSGGIENAAEAAQTTVGGGAENTAEAAQATISGGTENEVDADATSATIPGGTGAVATHHGQFVHASGYVDQPGDAQASTYVLRNKTVGEGLGGVNEEAELFLDGESERLTVEPNRSMAFEIQAVAHNSAGKVGGWHFRGAIKTVSGETAFVGDLDEYATVDDGLGSLEVVANDEHGALTIHVETEPWDDETTVWVATVRTTETELP